MVRVGVLKQQGWVSVSFRTGASFWPVTAIAAGFLVVSQLSACADKEVTSAARPPASSGNDYSAMNAEFLAEARKLALPTGYSWPERAPQAGPQDLYGTGYGTSQADQYWYCSWAKEWLDVQAEDASRTQAALTQIKSVTTKPLYLDSFAPEVQRETDREIAAAESGNPDTLAVGVRGNC